MTIQEHPQDTYITLVPHGELDANSSVHLDERIQALIEQGQVNIHIDGADIQYISSAGLGVFVSYLDEVAEQGGKFVLSSLRESVRDVFVILGLDQLDNLIIVERTEDVPAHF
ncbi:MAG: anti-sigma factor antagonist [Bacteroidetes bacterium]|nr:MAG: anti-sigma factor antagonist [Bacteroidota bacterium]